jgi:hypothetical protein
MTAIGHALMMSFTMAWEILWALILGFSLLGGDPGCRIEGGDVAPAA